jgi:hypothetical protein
MKKYFTDHDQHRFWKKNDIFGKKASQLAKRKKLTNFLIIYYVSDQFYYKIS